LDLIKGQKEEQYIHKVHALELDIQQRDGEIKQLKGELEQTAASLAQANRDKEELITEEMGQKHSDKMLRIIKQERDELSKRLQSAKEKLADFDAIKRERSQLIT